MTEQCRMLLRLPTNVHAGQPTTIIKMKREVVKTFVPWCQKNYAILTEVQPEGGTAGENAVAVAAFWGRTFTKFWDLFKVAAGNDSFPDIEGITKSFGVGDKIRFAQVLSEVEGFGQ